jgi:nucleotide-binding universal stress UspA family protein
MSPKDGLKDIRRILVALDASPASMAALDLAAELAVRYQAELMGVYVEDIDLLRSADIPLVKEIGYYSGTSRKIDSPHIERQLRAQAHRIERILASIAQKANLRWSFRSTRGVIHGELLTAAEGTDLIILGKSGWSRRRQMGSTAREIAVQSPIQSLILLHKVRPGTPVMVAFDGSPASIRALEAARLIRDPEIPLYVLLLAETKEDANRLKAEVEIFLADETHSVEFRWAANIKGNRVSQMAMISGCDVVVLPAVSDSFDPDALLSMLDEADCAVLLVR